MFTCVFCGNDFDYDGIEDLDPLCDDGCCCEECFYLYVIPAKLQKMGTQTEEPEETLFF